MNTVSKNLSPKNDLIVSDLRKVSAEQSYQKANLEMTKVQSIFSNTNSDYSNVQDSFQNSIFEKQLKEIAYKSVQNDLSFLRSKERAISNTEELSTTKFIKHEEQLKQNPEVVQIESQIKTNKTTIQAKQQELNQKTAVTDAYKAIIQKSIALTNKINLLLTSETTLVSEIASIKSQLAQLKSSSTTIAKVQASVTGSESTTGVDTSKSGDAEVVIAVGGQQSTTNKDITDSLKATIQDASQKQEEIDSKIKEVSIASLEELLEQKEKQLSTTREQIKTNKEKLAENEKLVQSSKQDNDKSVAQRSELAAEIEALTAETDALITERIEKDPEAVKFSSFSTVFNKVLQGSEDTGVGIEADLERTRAEEKKVKNKYEDKTVQFEGLEEVFNVKNFLRNTVKSNLEKSKAITKEQKKVFETLDIAA